MPHGDVSNGPTLVLATPTSPRPTDTVDVEEFTTAADGEQALQAVDAAAGEQPSPAEQVPASPPRAKPPGKGKCKGKGKGGRPAPPPKAPPPLQRPQAVGEGGGSLLCVRWKVSNAPGEDLHLLDNSAFAAPVVKRLREWPALPSGLVPTEHNVFTSPVQVGDEPSEELLSMCFPKCENNLSQRLLSQAEGGFTPMKRTMLLGLKWFHIIGVMLQRHLMVHREETALAGILTIKRSVLTCDFEIMRLEALSLIRTVLVAHEMDGRPISAYVKEHGNDSCLNSLEFPDHHRLVYELSKVPQIGERLECMLFQLSFQESLQTCRQNIETMARALQMLKAKRSLISRFFIIALRLGQMVDGSKELPSFELRTLERLATTRTTRFPDWTLMDLVLALMPPEDVKMLFSEQDLQLLQNARALTSHKVYWDASELVHGFHGVKLICDTGSFTSPSTGQAVKMERRRLTVPPRTPADEAAIDGDDRFHQVMQEFVEEHIADTRQVQESSVAFMLLYKELAVFFGDLKRVYPPPQSPQDGQSDLCEVFCNFAENVRQRSAHVDRTCLRNALGGPSVVQDAALSTVSGAQFASLGKPAPAAISA
eukprot:NODE_1193_length_2566_cov_6.362854.p1 GENE.NODE_1193_length_2566_cov_6.362854~~NODE_1193_length_2566_cov_6.362854.p1  ORF type:complete len:678 (+),score=178.14 NODE_1193_length_2566_cov_6.362854:250-2034(+)